MTIDALALGDRKTQHAEIANYSLLGRTHYRSPVPSGRLARVQSAVSRITRSGWRAPMTTLDSLNVFKYGKAAANLSLIYERLPGHNRPQVYDVVHCHFGPNGVRANAMRRFGVLRGPIITTFHGYDVNFLPRARPGMYNSLFAHGERFIVGSEFLRSKLMSLGAPEDRIVKLPMGVSVARSKCFDRVRQGQFRVLTVARLVEVKGIQYALKAMKKLLGDIPGLYYQIAGDGPLRNELERLSKNLGLSDKVEFIGPVTFETATILYQQAHVFLLPSIITDTGEEENQPVVLAEAQAVGLPVVATAIGGVSESIKDGVSGILVPPRDSEALASAIKRIADDQNISTSMGRMGRAYVEKYFDQERLNDGLLDLYRTVIRQN